MINLVTWFWKQPKSQNIYVPEDVNRWAEGLDGNITIPHKFSCVTDMPEGIDKGIEIIPMPQDFVNVGHRNWSANSGKPQCYRRLPLYRRDAHLLFGDRFASMDLDVEIRRNVDSIFERDDDFIITRGTSKVRPYNGSMQMLNAGARPQVYEKFTLERGIHASTLYIGSDQAWIAYCLGWCESVWTEEDGVYMKSPAKLVYWKPPEDCKMLFFPGGNGAKPMTRLKPIESSVPAKGKICLVFDERHMTLGQKIQSTLKVPYDIELIKKPTPFQDVEQNNYEMLYFFNYKWIRPYYKQEKIIAGIWDDGVLLPGKFEKCRGIHYGKGVDGESINVKHKVPIENETDITEIIKFITREVNRIHG